MMLGDKKKVAALIVAKMPKTGKSTPKDEPKDSEPTESMDDGLLSASEEMMSAIESKDAQGFASALQNFLQMCGGQESESEPKEDEADSF